MRSAWSLPSLPSVTRGSRVPVARNSTLPLSEAKVAQPGYCLLSAFADWKLSSNLMVFKEGNSVTCACDVVANASSKAQEARLEAV